MLRLENITGGYLEKMDILKSVNLEIQENETVAIVGQNGAGKSTLAKAIMNMLPQQTGSVFFKNKLINTLNTNKISKTGIKYFMQGGRVFPHLSVEENLNLAGLNMKKSKLEQRKLEVKNYFELFQNGRNGLSASYLSGGEKHQLALAMVLIDKPDFLILDEPSAGLSPSIRDRIYTILQEVRKRESLSILLIEQNIDIAHQFSQRTRLLKNGVLLPDNMDIHRIEFEFFGNNKN